MSVFGANGFLADELGGNVFVFGGDFLADFASRLLTSAANLVGGFQHHALHFQLHRWQRMSSTTQLPLKFDFVLLGQVWLQHLLADRRRTLRVLLQIPRHLLQLRLLLRVKLVGLGAEKLPFEFGDIGARLRQQLLLFF